MGIRSWSMMSAWRDFCVSRRAKRLAFDGTAIGLFGNWIKWFLLSIITLGIYSFWLQIKLKKWIVSHTHYGY